MKYNILLVSSLIMTLSPLAAASSSVGCWLLEKSPEIEPLFGGRPIINVIDIGGIARSSGEQIKIGDVKLQIPTIASFVEMTATLKRSNLDRLAENLGADFRQSLTILMNAASANDRTMIGEVITRDLLDHFANDFQIARKEIIVKPTELGEPGRPEYTLPNGTKLKFDLTIPAHQKAYSLIQDVFRPVFASTIQ